MRTSNKNLFHGILPGTTGESIETILDLVDSWNDLSESTRNDAWRLGKRELKKGAKKLDRIANEIVAQLHDWKLDLSSADNQEKLSQLGKHVDEEYF